MSSQGDRYSERLVRVNFVVVSDPRGRVVMPEGVQGIFWFAVLIRHTPPRPALVRSPDEGVGGCSLSPAPDWNTRSSPP